MLKAALEAQADGKLLVTYYDEEIEKIVLNDEGGSNISVSQGIIPTLRAETHGNLPCVIEQAEIFDMTHANDVIREFGEVSPTLQARMGTGGNQIPLVFEPAYCIQSNTIDRFDNSTAGTNCGMSTGRNRVIFSIDRAAFNQGENAKYDFQIDDSGVNSTIVARGPSAVCYSVPIEKLYVWIVRRLTPLECERLQGFPDDWTKYDTKGNEIKDTPRYKACGNSIAIPCAVRVFQGIVDAENAS